ncbi:MAG: glycosyltransferase family 4 protein [Chloroflexi bacterium]|nr:glycosyltransferase family 4 protein [Chloroflexota bacterium]
MSLLIGVDASRAVVAQRTGTENYTLYLVRALLHIGQGHRWRLYFREPPPRGLFPCNERIEWRVIPFPRLWTHLRLALEIALRPPDVLFVPAHVLPWIPPRRGVVTVHDLGYLHYPSAHPFLSRFYLDLSTRFNAWVARRVLVDSLATKRDLVERYGVAANKIVLAYPAGRPGMASTADPETLGRVRARYSTGARYFLYIGSLHPRKNLLCLLRAFASLLERDMLEEDIKLVLAGKPGWLYDEIAAAARQPHLRGRVVLAGYVPEDDLPALLSGALAFLLPSLYEGFGLPVLEAMACDVPVICSNVGSLPEVAGDAALLLDPRDQGAWAQAMARVAREPSLRRELIRRGRERLMRFSWESCARTVLATLEEVGRG